MKYKFNQQTLQYIPIQSNNWKWVVGLIVVFSFLSASIATKVIYENIPIVYRTPKEIFKPEEFKKEIFNSNCKFPNIVWQMAILESNNFRSPVFIRGFNSFGMKKAYQRPHLQQGEFANFAQYRNLHESLGDFLLWQTLYCQDIQTEEEMYDFLDKIYCTEIRNGKTYSDILKTIK